MAVDERRLLRLVGRMARREAATLLLRSDAAPLALRVDAQSCPACGADGSELHDRLSELRFRDVPLYVAGSSDGAEAVGLTMLACERLVGRSTLLAATAVARAGHPPRHGFRTRAATWAKLRPTNGPAPSLVEGLASLDQAESWVDQLLAEPTTVGEGYRAAGGAVLPWAARASGVGPERLTRSSYVEQWEDHRGGLATCFVTPHSAGLVGDELNQAYVAIRLAAVREAL